MLNKQSLLIKKTQTVKLNELNDEIKLRCLSITERDEFWERFGKDSLESKKWRAVLISLCVVDENDNRMFQESDIDSVMNMQASIAEEIVDHCLTINGMNKTATDDAKKN